VRVLVEAALAGGGPGAAAAVAGDAGLAAALWEAAEVAKIELSAGGGAALELPAAGVSSRLTAAGFEALTSGLRARLGPPLAAAAAASKTALATPLAALAAPGGAAALAVAAAADAAAAPPAGPAARYAPRPRRLTAVVLVGGATRMPSVARFVAEATGLAPCAGIDPELCVALGAAVHAGVLMGATSGLELMDGSYVEEAHGRATADAGFL